MYFQVMYLTLGFGVIAVVKARLWPNSSAPDFFSLSLTTPLGGSTRF